MRSLRRISALQLAAMLMILAILPGCGLFGPDPNGPGSYQAMAKTQQSAEETLKSKGATLERKTYPQGTAWYVDLKGKTLDDETWKALKSLDRLSDINLSETAFGDDQVSKLNDLGTVLTNVNLSKTQISDEGLNQLELGLLTQLDVSGTKVTAQGVSRFLQKRAQNGAINGIFKKPNVKR